MEESEPPNPAAPASTGTEGTLWSTLRGFPRPVWVLFAGMFVNRFGTFVVPFLALHLTRVGFSAGEASLAVGAYGAGHFAASVLGGYLADALGRRRTIVLSLLAGALSMVALSQAVELWRLCALAFLTGLTGELYRPAATALLADLVPDKDRVTAYAALRFAVNAGWAFGPAVAGFLAQRSYVWLFLGDAATSAMFGAIALALLPTDRQRLALGGGCWLRNALADVKASVIVVAGDRRFLRLLAGTFAVALVFLQMFTVLGLAIKASGYSESVYGLVLALNGVIIVLIEIPLSGVTRKWRPTPVIGSGFALIGLGAGLLVWATDAWQFAVGMAVFTLGEMISMPMALAHASRLAPADMRGRYMGVYGLTWATALTLGPSIGMAVFTWSSTTLWAGCGGLGLIAAAIILAGDRPRQADEVPSLVVRPVS